MFSVNNSLGPDMGPVVHIVRFVDGRRCDPKESISTIIDYVILLWVVRKNNFGGVCSPNVLQLLQNVNVAAASLRHGHRGIIGPRQPPRRGFQLATTAVFEAALRTGRRWRSAHEGGRRADEGGRARRIGIMAVARVNARDAVRASSQATACKCCERHQKSTADTSRHRVYMSVF